MTIIEQNSQAVTDLQNRLDGRVYECRVWLCPEEEGGYSVILPFLPGVASQGETREEALQNIKEAFQGAAAEYIESQQPIPWCRDTLHQKPADAIEKWILVNV
jgi:predicted RNase H-like HicB family nuclease